MNVIRIIGFVVILESTNFNVLLIKDHVTNEYLSAIRNLPALIL